MLVTVPQIKAARAMLDLKQQELAEKAGISTGTLNNIERGVQADPKLSTLRAIQKALETEGISFTETATGDLGITLKARRRIDAVIKLLIIDDNDADRRLYKAWIGKNTRMKCSIVEASDAKQGYETFLRQAPDCILLDFMMYGVDGFQLLVNMQREHAVLPPIIFLTGMHNPTLEQSVRASGAFAYLNKNTLNADLLCQTIAQATASMAVAE